MSGESGRISAAEVFGTDYTNRDAVIRLARKMGKGMTVCYRPGVGYSVTHTERRDRWAHLPKEHVFHIT